MNQSRETVCCDYCGLPIGNGWFARSKASAKREPEPEYCCSGCRLAAEIAGHGDAPPTALLTRLGFAIFLTLNVVCVTMVLWSGDVYADGDPDRTRVGSLLADLFRYLSLLFSWPVAYLLAGPLIRNSWQQLRRGAAATDLLLVLGVFAAFAYSTISVLRGAGHIYFEVGCVVLVFVTLGRWLETTGRQQATASLDALARLLPNEVRRLVAGQETATPLEQIVRGDRLRIVAGERIPTDGRLVSGHAAIDEQLVTGESQPSIKEPGDTLYGGTLNHDGTLVVEVTAAAREGTLQRLVDAVAAARRTKGRYQRLVERVASWFLPIAMLIAAGTLVWHATHSGIEPALLAGMAVVLIACPCALGLATPLAVWTAIGAAARRGIVFRHGEALERLAGATSIYFDKTGTLSTGDAHVVEFLAAEGESPDEIHRHAASLAAASDHPFSKAIRGYLASALDARQHVPAVQTLPGRGLSARLSDGVTCHLGSLRWLESLGLKTSDDLRFKIETLQQQGLALTGIGWDNALRGVYVFAESMRPEVADAILALRQLRLKIAALSGDHIARVEQIGAQLGIAVTGELLPQDKLAAITSARASGEKTVMVGDGVNDAPALAAADVGVAMGCGADVSRDAAEVCLLGSNLSDLVDAIRLSRATVRAIRQNLFWAFVYNTAGIALACVGMLNPMWAAAAMTVSSVLVVTNSLRLAHVVDRGRSPNHQPSETTRAIGPSSAIARSALGDPTP